MDVRFDSDSAQHLINSMSSYCSSIQKDALEVLELINSIPQWQDQQSEQFCDAIRLICSDLDKALRLQSDYLNLYQNRVNELRG